MVLGNKLGISSDAELAREEERLTKTRALELFERGLLDGLGAGTFAGLAQIHAYLFQDVYDFAGRMRRENISKAAFASRPRSIWRRRLPPSIVCRRQRSTK